MGGKWVGRCWVGGHKTGDQFEKGQDMFITDPRKSLPDGYVAVRGRTSRDPKVSLKKRRKNASMPFAMQLMWKGRGIKKEDKISRVPLHPYKEKDPQSFQRSSRALPPRLRSRE